MSAFLGLGSLLGFIVCLVLLIIKAITKKPKKTTAILLAVFFVLFIVAFSMPTNNKDEASAEDVIATPEPTPEPTEEPTATPEPTPEKTPDPTDAPEPTEEPVQETEAPTEDVIDIETVIGIIELSMVDTFDTCIVEGDENAITISVAVNGLVEEVVMAKALGYDETYEPWANARNNIVSMYDATLETIKMFGWEDTDLTLIVLNDSNTENYLLIVYGGVIIYDVMAE